MYNKKVLSDAMKNLNKVKVRVKKKAPIVDPMGQWNHPGKVTRIPGRHITMSPDPRTGEPLKQPLLGISDKGEQQMMFPGGEYVFEEGTKYVDEKPVLKKFTKELGGSLPKAQVGFGVLGKTSKTLNESLNFLDDLYSGYQGYQGRPFGGYSFKPPVQIDKMTKRLLSEPYLDLSQGLTYDRAGDLSKYLGDFTFKFPSSGYDATQKMLQMASDPQWQPSQQDFFTNDEMANLIRQEKSWIEAKKKFDQMDLSAYKEPYIIPGTDYQTMKLPEGLFENMFPNVSRANFRSKLVTPEQENTLWNFLHPTGSNLEPDPYAFTNTTITPGLLGDWNKTRTVMMSGVRGNDELLREASTLKMHKDNLEALATLPDEEFLSEFGTWVVARLAPDDLKGLSTAERKEKMLNNATPEQISEWRAQLTQMAWDDYVREANYYEKQLEQPFTGSDAWKQITDQTGYKNQYGGLVKAKEGGEREFVNSREHGIDTPIYVDVEVKPSPIAGDGLFSKQSIPGGTEIGVSHVRKTFNKNGQQYMAPFPSKILGMYNHDEKSPNVTEVDNGDHIVLIALRDIQPGEELISNYNDNTIEDLEKPEDFKNELTKAKYGLSLPKAQDGKHLILKAAEPVLKLATNTNPLKRFVGQNIITGGIGLGPHIAPNILKDMAMEAAHLSGGNADFDLNQYLNYIKSGDLPDDMYVGKSFNSMISNEDIQQLASQYFPYSVGQRDLIDLYFTGNDQFFTEQPWLSHLEGPGSLDKYTKIHGPLKSYQLQSEIPHNQPVSGFELFENLKIADPKYSAKERMQNVTDLKTGAIHTNYGLKKIFNPYRHYYDFDVWKHRQLDKAAAGDKDAVRIGFNKLFDRYGDVIPLEVGTSGSQDPEKGLYTDPIVPIDDIAGHMKYLRRISPTQFDLTTRDVWGFHPKDYTKKWFYSNPLEAKNYYDNLERHEQFTEDMRKYVANLGPRLFTRMGNPFLLTQSNPIFWDKWKNQFKKGGLINRRDGGTTGQPPINYAGPVNYDYLLDEVYSKYPGLQIMNDQLGIIGDPSFNREATGVGDIEFFGPNENVITYPSGFAYAHPNPGGYGIPFNPQTNDAQSIALDMLHGMDEADPEYKKLKKEFGDAYFNSKFGEDFENEVEWLIEDIGEDKFNEWYGGDAQKYFDHSYIDGVIRNLLFEGTPEEFEKHRYWDKAQEVYLSDPKLKKAFNKLKKHLTKVKSTPDKYIQAELSQEEIDKYVKGGYIVEELPKANTGLIVKNLSNLSKIKIPSPSPSNILGNIKNFGNLTFGYPEIPLFQDYSNILSQTSVDGWVERMNMAQGLKDMNYVGDEFDQLRMFNAAKTDDAMNALMKHAINYDLTGWRQVKPQLQFTGSKYTNAGLRQTTLSNEEMQQQREAMINAGVDLNDPKSISAYFATHIPFQRYGLREGGLETLDGYGADAIYLSARPEKYDSAYGPHMWRVRQPFDFSTGNWLDWYAQHYINKNPLKIPGSSDFNPALRDSQNVFFDTGYSQGNILKPVIGIGQGLNTRRWASTKGTKVAEPDIDPNNPFPAFYDYMNLTPEERILINAERDAVEKGYKTGWSDKYNKGGELPKARFGLTVPKIKFPKIPKQSIGELTNTGLLDDHIFMPQSGFKPSRDFSSVTHKFAAKERDLGLSMWSPENAAKFTGDPINALMYSMLGPVMYGGNKLLNRMLPIGINTDLRNTIANHMNQRLSEQFRGEFLDPEKPIPLWDSNTTFHLGTKYGVDWPSFSDGFIARHNQSVLNDNSRIRDLEVWRKQRQWAKENNLELDPTGQYVDSEGYTVFNQFEPDTPILENPFVVKSGFDGNFLTRPLTIFGKNELTPGKHLYRKIGNSAGLRDLINKGGAQAPGPLRMNSGFTIDTPFFGIGETPNENYRGIFAVETALPSKSKYNWSSQAGGTSNYGVAPYNEEGLMKNVPLEDLNVFRKKWFSNNYRKLDPENLDKGLKYADAQKFFEDLWKWGVRGGLGYGAYQYYEAKDKEWKEELEKKLGGSVKDKLPKANTGKIVKSLAKLYNVPALSGVKKDWSGNITKIYNPYFEEFSEPLADLSRLTKSGDFHLEQIKEWESLAKFDKEHLKNKILQINNPIQYETLANELFQERFKQIDATAEIMKKFGINSPEAKEARSVLDKLHLPIDPATMSSVPYDLLSNISDQSENLLASWMDRFNLPLDQYNLQKAIDQKRIDAYRNAPLSYKLFGLSPGWKVAGIRHPFETDVLFPHHKHNKIGKDIYDSVWKDDYEQLDNLRQFHPWSDNTGEKYIQYQNDLKKYNDLNQRLRDIIKSSSSFPEGDNPFESIKRDGGNVKDKLPKAHSGKIVKALSQVTKLPTPTPVPKLPVSYPNQFMTTSNLGKFAGSTGNINLDQLKAAIGKESMGLTHKWPMLEKQLITEFGEDIPTLLPFSEVQRLTNQAIVPYTMSLNPQGNYNYGIWNDGGVDYLQGDKKLNLGFTKAKDIYSLEGAAKNDYSNAVGALSKINFYKDDFATNQFPLKGASLEDIINETLYDFNWKHTPRGVEGNPITSIEDLEMLINNYKHEPLSQQTSVLSGLGKGSLEHNNPEGTLAAAHSYIDPDTPDTRTYTQFQSDALQGTHHIWKNKEKQIEKIKKQILDHENEKAHFLSLNEDPEAAHNIYQEPINNLNKQIVKLEEEIIAAKGSNPKQKELLEKNWESVLLQQLMTEAAAEGMTKIRIPTGETTIKVQNYHKIPQWGEDDWRDVQNIFEADNFEEAVANNLETSAQRDIKLDYTKQQKTVIRRYDKLPKLLKKTFGFTDDQIKTVTDRFGNTWFEVEIPESFLQGQGQIIHKFGGSVNIGDEVDEATMQRLIKEGYTFEEI